MVITSAEFIISNSRVEKCPTTGLPEYAFIGRSNVGKSSLINMLTGRKGLAMTSQKPGKTQLINHFLINRDWYLVDLPGYGYARLSRDGRDGLRRMIEDYILERTELVCLFVLLDSRLEPQRIDLEFIEWLGEEGIPFALVFTKADKISRGRHRALLQEYVRGGLISVDVPVITSGENRSGIEDLRNFIGRFLGGAGTEGDGLR